MWGLAGGALNRVDGRTAFEAMRKGDATARAVVDQYLEYLGEGLSNFVNIFQPEVIALGGGVGLDFIKSAFLHCKPKTVIFGFHILCNGLLLCFRYCHGVSLLSGGRVQKWALLLQYGIIIPHFPINVNIQPTQYISVNIGCFAY